MPAYTFPDAALPTRPADHEVMLVANGDARAAANRQGWAVQEQLEEALADALHEAERELVRAHPFKNEEGHGFIASQREGLDVFAAIHPEAPVIVASSIWQYSQQVLSGLANHAGPILTVGRWSGEYPGVVGLLNLNGSLTKAGVKHSTLWSETLTDQPFRLALARWLRTGRIRHRQDHVIKLDDIPVPTAERRLGEALAEDLRRRGALLGVFDEGCMGMFNAIIPDGLLQPAGVFKERISQSALLHEALGVPDVEAAEVLSWIERAGMTFDWGEHEATGLTRGQVLDQCRIYIAALRMGDDAGCDAVGIQYQLGLVDSIAASDLAEGMLNNGQRPPVRSLRTGKVLHRGLPLPHFNEADECAGLDGLMTHRLHVAMGEPPENTLHDLRWADHDASGTTDADVWVFQISGAAPPAHLAGGWKGASGLRQPSVYFPRGGSSLRGVGRPGEIIWSRIYIRRDRLHMDLGRAEVIELPDAEVQRRWEHTTPQWPQVNVVLYGVERDAMLARHQSNHIQVAYARDADAADRSAYAKAAMARAMGMEVALCGTRRGGKGW